MKNDMLLKYAEYLCKKYAKDVDVSGDTIYAENEPAQKSEAPPSSKDAEMFSKLFGRYAKLLNNFIETIKMSDYLSSLSPSKREFYFKAINKTFEELLWRYKTLIGK